jgi:hypothetical protein
LIKERDKAYDPAAVGFRLYRASINGALLDIRCIVDAFWRVGFF